MPGLTRPDRLERKENIMTYNGWKNWETWNVVLWCDNEEAIYRDRMHRKPRTADECEDFIKEWFPKGTPDFCDEDPFCRAAIQVDWQEIADHWAENYDENIIVKAS
jgi:hypothetical protein